MAADCEDDMLIANRICGSMYLVMVLLTGSCWQVKLIVAEGNGLKN